MIHEESKIVQRLAQLKESGQLESIARCIVGASLIGDLF